MRFDDGTYSGEIWDSPTDIPNDLIEDGELLSGFNVIIEPTTHITLDLVCKLRVDRDSGNKFCLVPRPEYTYESDDLKQIVETQYRFNKEIEELDQQLRNIRSEKDGVAKRSNL